MNYFFGANNKEKAVEFYDESFDGCGINKVHDQGRTTQWGSG